MEDESAQLVLLRQVNERLVGVLLLAQTLDQEQQIRAAQILAEVSDAVMLSDKAYKLEAWNWAAEMLYGWPADEVLGHSQERVLLPALDELHWAGSDGETEMVSGLQYRKTKEAVMVDGKIRRLRDDDGKVSGFVTVTRAAQQEGGTAPQDTEVERMKAEFLSTVHHELRTPLTAIIGFTSLMKERQSSDREYLEPVLESAQHLLELIDQILLASRFSAGAVTERVTRCNLGSLILEVVGELANLRSADVSLHATCPDTPVEVETDPLLLRKVLEQLIRNAIKFTPEGKVDIICQVLETGTVEITVRDTGIGIALGRQHLLFRPFSQADASLSRRYPGMGLGLHLCKKIVEQLRGTIRVQSNSDHGTSFIVELPL